VLHTYVDAPLAVSVAELPEQIEVDEGLMDTVSAPPTVTVAEAVPEQPLEFDPVTE
jgi:hypothetical protein